MTTSLPLTLEALGAKVKVLVVVHIPVPASLDGRLAAVALEADNVGMGVGHAHKEEMGLLNVPGESGGWGGVESCNQTVTINYL